MEVDTGSFAALTERVEELAADVDVLRRQITFRLVIEEETGITWRHPRPRRPRGRPSYLHPVDGGGS